MSAPRRFVLTSAEASVLTKVDKYQSSIPELTVAARLSPSVVREAVTHLAEKDLIVVSTDPQFVKLTEQGDTARRLVEKGDWGQVLVLNDYGPDSRRDVEAMDDDAIDRALDEELGACPTFHGI